MSASRQWKIRLARGSDLHFLYSTWLKSYRCDSALGRSTKKSVFFSEYYAVLDYLFQKASTQTLVACLPDDELIILGFLVFEPQVIHYCFTKQSFRRVGIAKSLCEAAFKGSLNDFQGVGEPSPTSSLSYSHRTRQADLILKRYPELTYNPFLLFLKLSSENSNNGAKNG